MTDTSMIVVFLWKGSDKIDQKTCDKGHLLPTIATIMQNHDNGTWKHGQEYAISWRVIKE